MKFNSPYTIMCTGVAPAFFNSRRQSSCLLKGKRMDSFRTLDIGFLQSAALQFRGTVSIVGDTCTFRQDKSGGSLWKTGAEALHSLAFLLGTASCGQHEQGVIDVEVHVVHPKAFTNRTTDRPLAAAMPAKSARSQLGVVAALGENARAKGGDG